MPDSRIPSFSPFIHVVTKVLFSIVSPTCIVLIFGIPLWSTVKLYNLLENRTYSIVSLALLPLVYVFLYMVIAGLISLPAQRAIVRGKFPRKTDYPIYALRRVYGLCWACVYYFRPLYQVILFIPIFKVILFRLFGYRGSTKFSTYPDTWIRDLPLLDLGENAYLSNRATIGTNIVLMDGDIYVDSISIGTQSIIGHLSMLAPGVKIGEKVQVGVGCAIGMGVVMGSQSDIGPMTTIDHGALIGNNVRIGTNCYVGVRSVIGDDIVIPPGSVIPKKSTIQSDIDLQNILKS